MKFHCCKGKQICGKSLHDRWSYFHQERNSRLKGWDNPFCPAARRGGRWESEKMGWMKRILVSLFFLRLADLLQADFNITQWHRHNIVFVFKNNMFTYNVLPKCVNFQHQHLFGHKHLSIETCMCRFVHIQIWFIRMTANDFRRSNWNKILFSLPIHMNCLSIGKILKFLHHFKIIVSLKLFMILSWEKLFITLRSIVCTAQFRTKGRVEIV